MKQNVIFPIKIWASFSLTRCNVFFAPLRKLSHIYIASDKAYVSYYMTLLKYCRSRNVISTFGAFNPHFASKSYVLHCTPRTITYTNAWMQTAWSMQSSRVSDSIKHATQRNSQPKNPHQVFIKALISFSKLLRISKIIISHEYEITYES